MNNHLDGRALVEAGPLLAALLRRVDLGAEPREIVRPWSAAMNAAVTRRGASPHTFQPTGRAALDRIIAAARPRILYGVIERPQGPPVAGAGYISAGKLADSIVLPHREAFRSGMLYRHVVAHELAHWTSHPGRCDRETFRDRRAEQLLCNATPQAREEITAELAAVLALLVLGEPTFATLKLAAQHVHHWTVKGASAVEERRALLESAAPDAEAAASYLLQLA